MKRTFLIGSFIVLVVAGLFAQNQQFELSFAPRFWGATIGARYSLSAPEPYTVETSLLGGISSAYETVGYYRSPDGSLFSGGDGGFSAESTDYNRFDLYWILGIQQGILPRTDGLTEDRAVVFAYYRGRYDLPFADSNRLYFSSGLPETDGGLLGSIQAGLAYSDVALNEVTRVRKGLRSELVLEWGPPFLHNQIFGEADFTRTTLCARGFVPLYSAEPVEGRNSFSTYLALFGAFDWAAGPEIPMEVRSTIGTRSERPGLGGSVRGAESGRFDATVKAVANAEVRASLPTISLGSKLPALVPGLLVYTDGGYYNDTDQLSPVAADNSGTLLSSGAGIYLEVVNIAEIIFYTNYLWTPDKVDGSHWTPFSLGFGFHY